MSPFGAGLSIFVGSGVSGVCGVFLGCSLVPWFVFDCFFTNGLLFFPMMISHMNLSETTSSVGELKVTPVCSTELVDDSIVLAIVSHFRLYAIAQSLKIGLVNRKNLGSNTGPMAPIASMSSSHLS